MIAGVILVAALLTGLFLAAIVAGGRAHDAANAEVARRRDGKSQEKELGPRDQPGREPDPAENDHDQPDSLAEMSAAMRDATGRARSYAARWIDERNRMAMAVDEYEALREHGIGDRPAGAVPECKAHQPDPDPPAAGTQPVSRVLRS
jgi:hypothetical protein